MKKRLWLALLLGCSLAPIPPAAAQVVVHNKPGHKVVHHGHYRRSRRNRRARNTAIGAAGGAAAGAIIGRGRGAGAGAVIGGTAGALTPTRRRR
jgi:outer membrane lipoprotein SlyB